MLRRQGFLFLIIADGNSVAVEQNVMITVVWSRMMVSLSSTMQRKRRWLYGASQRLDLVGVIVQTRHPKANIRR